ncbi:hypothetical protein MFIFM68171_08418 [Madurella fahalii]|uniref:Uncharacterized protein n=1 Tax=Madurella fahalii TaxID=1157608 RepID=A0ABQ0GKA7_9PEZI
MNPKPKKSSLKGEDPDDLIERAIRDGLSEDKSGIDDKLIHKELAPSSKPRYAKMRSVWAALVRRFPGSDPRNMETLKHFAESVARSTTARLDKTLDRPTVKTIRNKVRKFMSAWERETNLPIPKDVHDSMCPYIQNVRRYKIPLSIMEKEPTFLTIENYVYMQQKHWKNDYHNYVHEGVRVFPSCLLNMHCYTSARLQEICMSKICFAWLGGKTERQTSSWVSRGILPKACKTPRRS